MSVYQAKNYCSHFKTITAINSENAKDQWVWRAYS